MIIRSAQPTDVSEIINLTCLAAVGIASSYPAAQHQITAEMRQWFAAKRLIVLEDFDQSRVEGSWYLDRLGVKPEFQHQGIGIKLLQATKKQAKRQQDQQLSLIVFTHNTTALSLYKRQGFKQVKLIQIGDYPQLSQQKSCILMQCHLV